MSLVWVSRGVNFAAKADPLSRSPNPTNCHRRIMVLTVGLRPAVRPIERCALSEETCRNEKARKSRIRSPGLKSMGCFVSETARLLGSASLGQGATAGVHGVPAEHLLDAEELVVLGGAVGAAE